MRSERIRINQWGNLGVMLQLVIGDIVFLISYMCFHPAKKDLSRAKCHRDVALLP